MGKLKRALALLFALAFALSLCSCGGTAGKNTTASGAEAEIVWDGQAAENPMPEDEGLIIEDVTAMGEDGLSFTAFEGLRFFFSSGAGGWATEMTIAADGRFSGRFHDSDMGVTGVGYPNGTMFLSDFSGQFSRPVKVNDYTYSVQILELNYDEKFGTQEILDGVLYCYGDAYGLEGTGEFLIYLPGAPLEELPEEFRSWVGYYDLSYTADTELPFYALFNVDQQLGFSSYRPE